MSTLGWILIGLGVGFLAGTIRNMIKESRVHKNN